ncbi:beta-galactosidase [Schleiferilactobacillus harbinensis]|uniref:Beta-galactosidase n=1 Tax=Schleiferilactobacillus harbinensis DSM 16991 TaxID=1122147 RepID=A0A0R1XD91_9LACO|nr:beta-galactosidase [Schleiferilactobacillus harbinensis]KRM27621.1 beta-galactosidase [Schleiferilactobacillus harbinensis DSM 16991]QFR63311.1 beta-galactosidase [Schleiferilactobacillus harbinensis]
MTERVLSIDGFLHGGDYNPEQWQAMPEILERDIALMQEAHINTVTVGMFSWAALEPQEGDYHFEWLDQVFDRIEAIGGHVILATPSGARPAWMAKKYPEVLRTDEYGHHLEFGERHNHCFTSPIYRAKVAQINRLLAERYGQRQGLLLWHVSNEYGGECHCALCRAAFQDWLKARYGTLGKLNTAWNTAFWSHTYDTWNEIIPPSPTSDSTLNGLNLDWRRFVSDQTMAFYQNEIGPLRAITPDVPITTNFMADTADMLPFHGLDYQKFAKQVDVVSWDCYPQWHNDQESDAVMAMKVSMINNYYYHLKNQPFLIMESTPSQVNWHPFNRAKRPGMHELSSLQLVSEGADSVLYFQLRQSRGASEQFHGAVIGHDGSDQNRVFQAVTKVGADLQQLQPVVHASKVPGRIAIVYNQESNWALDDAKDFAQSTKRYWQTLQDHYAYFWMRNIPVDVVTTDADLNAYQMVIDPMHYMMSEAWMTKLKAYVQGGGTVVGTYLSGIVDKRTLAYLGGWPKPLQDIYGLKVLETDTLYPKQKNGTVLNDQLFVFKDYCAVVKDQGATTLVQYTKDFYADTPAVTRNKFGQGTSYFQAARGGADFLTAFYDRVLAEVGIDTEHLVKADQGVSVQQRQSGDKLFTFVMNFTQAEATYQLQQTSTDLLGQKTLPPGDHRLPGYGVAVFQSDRK